MKIAERQEEELTRRSTGVRKIPQRKTKRLEDLFRPPNDILFLGSFVEAREHAKTLNRWLLVNVQNPLEFSCQILNRDLWPNKLIREIVKDHFVLWQVSVNLLLLKKITFERFILKKYLLFHRFCLTQQMGNATLTFIMSRNILI